MNYQEFEVVSALTKSVLDKLSVSRNKIIHDVLLEVSLARMKQIENGADPKDKNKSIPEWVATLTRHLGLATGDMDVPVDSKRFVRQMITVAAIAVAAVEHERLRELHRRRKPGEYPEGGKLEVEESIDRENAKDYYLVHTGESHTKATADD